jgi:nitrate/TMAO reductase-like tetraheme cytochrome c subunit
VIRRAAQAGKVIRERIARLPPAALVGLGVVAIAVVAVGSVLLYRTYDYVQHDNDFCMSCHLMADPFERFAQSEHRGLGCKACHQPTMRVRTQMALTQILENPDQIETHAEVPNSACADCHIRGDPDRWRIIAQSAGHRVHLESTDPSLRGLACVECHSSSVHQFAATDRTCAQAGCHETVDIRLGRMGALTIHCAACHEFNAPVAVSMPAESLAVALRPQREECLSCHAMRVLVQDFPAHADDPHAGSCGACHNPHDQTTPAQAVQSCAVGGCHARADTITPFHRGLMPSVLSNCTACHTAHTFSTTTECLACHQDVYTTALTVSTQIGRPTAQAMDFRHAQHRDVDCAACHSTEQSHGAVAITSFAECRSCHHTGPVAEPCTRCHERGELVRQYRAVQPMRIASAPAVNRAITFDHRWHQAESCNACHTAGLTQSAAAVSCTACHEEHHRPDTNCRLCHTPPSPQAHTATAHLTCTGAGCHTPPPFQGVPRTRQLCLSCHQELVDHYPGRNCVDCHALPAGRTE